MKTIKFTSQNKDIDVEYKVDLIGNSEPINVFDVTQFVDGVAQWGLNGTAIIFGMMDKNKINKTSAAENSNYTLTEWVTFAQNKNLTMVILEDGKANITKNTLTTFAWVTETLDAGVCGVKQLEVVTFPATAGATQGDYILMTNALTGETAAIWLDIDDAGTEPTGAKYVAADYQIKVGIATGDSAAQVAGKAVTAIEASAWEDEISLTDNTDGSVDFQQDYSGDIADADPENADDSGVGSITASTSADGTDGTTYNVELETEGGSTPISYATESTLPEGLSLSEDGVISGTPREDGTFTITIVATDYFGLEISLTDVDIVVTETA